MTLVPTDNNPSFCNLEKRIDLGAYRDVLKKWTDIRANTLESRFKKKAKPLIKQLKMTYNNESLVLPLRLTIKSIEKTIMEAYLPEESRFASNEYMKVFEVDMREGRRRMEEEGGGGSINDLSLGDLFVAGRNDGKISIKVFFEDRRDEEERRKREEEGVRRTEEVGRRKEEEEARKREEEGGRRMEEGGKRMEEGGRRREEEGMRRREEEGGRREEAWRKREEDGGRKKEEEVKKKEEEIRRRRVGREEGGRRRKDGGGCLGLYYYGFQCSEWMDCTVVGKVWVKKDGEAGKGRFKYYEVVFGKDAGGKTTSYFVSFFFTETSP